MLAEKDQAEAEALAELRETAQKELQDWYNHFEDQLKHTKDSNRLVACTDLSFFLCGKIVVMYGFIYMYIISDHLFWPLSFSLFTIYIHMLYRCLLTFTLLLLFLSLTLTHSLTRSFSPY